MGVPVIIVPQPTQVLYRRGGAIIHTREEIEDIYIYPPLLPRPELVTDYMHMDLPGSWHGLLQSGAQSLRRTCVFNDSMHKGSSSSRSGYSRVSVGLDRWEEGSGPFEEFSLPVRPTGLVTSPPHARLFDDLPVTIYVSQGIPVRRRARRSRDSQRKAPGIQCCHKLNLNRIEVAN
ncbi:hypothetical protein BDM02DRAFT_1777006 [Thelephora ganbajun]|uniref:Uncharacterized protein n=1 Tax=Thelephora ganbajun TaxID=370292 RepID=A0ACB6ZJ91_THEGA|nr:hypothetical protein BDM02DRAFT_1777006 [Thelephora ganbajun]